MNRVQTTSYIKLLSRPLAAFDGRTTRNASTKSGKTPIAHRQPNDRFLCETAGTLTFDGIRTSSRTVGGGSKQCILYPATRLQLRTGEETARGRNEKPLSYPALGRSNGKDRGLVDLNGSLRW